MEQEQQTGEVPSQVSSLLTRATNVFASPGELYGEVVKRTLSNIVACAEHLHACPGSADNHCSFQ